LPRYLAKFTKDPDERKKYTISYVDWLAEDESLVTPTITVTPTTASPLTVDTEEIDTAESALSFFVEGGLDGTRYKVIVQVETSEGQIKEDEILFIVRE